MASILLFSLFFFLPAEWEDVRPQLLLITVIAHGDWNGPFNETV